MSLYEFCRENLVTIEPGASLLDAARLMKDKHVGDLIVVDQLDGRIKPVGIITDRDIVLCCTDGQALEDKRVDSVMTRHMTVLNQDEGIFNASALMSQIGVRRLPIVNNEGMLTGILTADDLYQLLSVEFSNLARICDRQIAKEGQERGLYVQPSSNRESTNREFSSFN